MFSFPEKVVLTFFILAVLVLSSFIGLSLAGFAVAAELCLASGLALAGLGIVIGAVALLVHVWTEE